MYSFAAERQLIFYANVGGRSRLIQFGERNHAGASTFMTKEEKVAEAVRRNSMFKRGVITETTVKEEKPAMAEAKPQLAENKETGGKTGKKASTKSSKKTACKKGVKSETVKAEEQPQRTGQEENARSFRDFTHAREWFSKEYGISRKELRNPTLLSEYARKYNVTIKYEEV